MLVNAITTSLASDEVKSEGQADWLEPDLHLIVGTGALAKRHSFRGYDEESFSQVHIISGRMEVSF